MLLYTIIDCVRIAVCNTLIKLPLICVKQVVAVLKFEGHATPQASMAELQDLKALLAAGRIDIQWTTTHSTLLRLCWLGGCRQKVLRRSFVSTHSST